MPLKILANYLDKYQIGYTTIKHPDLITEKEIEGVSHTAGNGFAKAIMVKADNACVMVVIPSLRSLDLDILRELLGAGRIEPISRQDFQELFPECETDAMPPFGNLFGFPVYIDKELTRDDCIAFNAGDHHEVIMMSYREFNRLVQPSVISFRNTVE